MNNKNSRLKKLILGSTMLTAFSGFTAEINAVAKALSAAGPTVIEKDTDSVANGYYTYKPGAGGKLKLSQIGDLGAVYSKSKTRGDSVLVLGTDGSSTAMAIEADIFLSAGNYLIVERESGYTGLMKVKLSISGVGNDDFTPNDTHGLLATADGGVTEVDGRNGQVEFYGSLDPAKTHTFKFVNSKDAGTTKKDAALYGDLTNIAAAKLAKLTVESSGLGAHRYHTHGVDLSIEGITVDKGTGPVVYAKNHASDTALKVNKFNVHESSGVMIKNDMANSTLALEVKTTNKTDAASFTTLTLASHSGTLAGDNTDVDKARFILRGEAEVTAATPAKAPIITVKMEDRKYAHIDAYDAGGAVVVAKSGVL